MNREESKRFLEIIRDARGKMSKNQLFEVFRITREVAFNTALEGFDDAIGRNRSLFSLNDVIRAIWSRHNAINVTPSKKESAESLKSIFSRMGFQR